MLIQSEDNWRSPKSQTTCGCWEAQKLPSFSIRIQWLPFIDKVYVLALQSAVAWNYFNCNLYETQANWNDYLCEWNRVQLSHHEMFKLFCGVTDFRSGNVLPDLVNCLSKKWKILAISFKSSSCIKLLNSWFWIVLSLRFKSSWDIHI